MSKNKLLTTGFDPIPNTGVFTFGEKIQPVPKITGVKPCGSQILIEMLTAQELANTIVQLSDKTDLKVPLQGYVRGVGPGFKTADWGFNVGDRVLISGGGVIAPTYDETHRDRFFMEPHAVKSVLVEE